MREENIRRNCCRPRIQRRLRTPFISIIQKLSKEPRTSKVGGLHCTLLHRMLVKLVEKVNRSPMKACHRVRKTPIWSSGMDLMIRQTHIIGQSLSNIADCRSSKYRWWLTFQVSVITLCVAFTSSVFTAGIPAIAAEFHTTDLITTVGVTTYVLGFAFGPLVWAPLSEARGRRPVYLVSWTVFTIFQIPCALAKNPSIPAI